MPRLACAYIHTTWRICRCMRAARVSRISPALRQATPCTTVCGILHFRVSTLTRDADMSSQIDTLLSEQRRFPPAPAFVKDANGTQSLYDQAARDRLAFWAEQAKSLALDDAVGVGARVDTTSREVVHRWPAQRGGQLHRPAPRAARGATRPPSSGKASPATGASTPTGSWARKSAARANALKAARREAGRPRRDLPADDPRGGDRHARLRPHRRRALRGVRRILGRGPARPDQRLRVRRAHHRRRRLPPRQRAAAQALRRRGARRMPHDPARRRRAPACRAARATRPSPP